MAHDNSRLHDESKIRAETPDLHIEAPEESPTQPAELTEPLRARVHSTISNISNMFSEGKSTLSANTMRFLTKWGKKEEKVAENADAPEADTNTPDQELDLELDRLSRGEEPEIPVEPVQAPRAPEVADNAVHFPFSVARIEEMCNVFNGYSENVKYIVGNREFTSTLDFAKHIIEEEEKGTAVSMQNVRVQYGKGSVRTMTPELLKITDSTLKKADLLLPHIRDIEYVDSRRQEVLDDASLEQELSKTISLSNGMSITMRYSLEGASSPVDLLHRESEELIALIPFIEKVAESLRVATPEPEDDGESENKPEETGEHLPELDLSDPDDSGTMDPEDAATVLDENVPARDPVPPETIEEASTTAGFSFKATDLISPESVNESNREQYRTLYELLDNTEIIDSLVEETAPDDDTKDNYKILLRAALVSMELAIEEIVIGAPLNGSYPIGMSLVADLPATKEELRDFILLKKQGFVGLTSIVKLIEKCKEFLNTYIPSTGVPAKDTHELDPDEGPHIPENAETEEEHALGGEEITPETKSELALFLNSANIAKVATESVDHDGSKTHQFELVLMLSIALAKVRRDLTVNDGVVQTELMHNLLGFVQDFGATHEMIETFIVTHGLIETFEEEMYQTLKSGITIEDLRAGLEEEYEDLARQMNGWAMLSPAPAVSEVTPEETTSEEAHKEGKDVVREDWKAFAAEIKDWATQEAADFQKYHNDITGLNKVQFTAQKKVREALNIIDFFFKISKNGVNSSEEIAKILYGIMTVVDGKAIKQNLDSYRQQFEKAKEEWEVVKIKTIEGAIPWEDVPPEILQKMHATTIKEELSKFPELGQFSERLHKDSSLYRKLPVAEVEMLKQIEEIFIQPATGHFDVERGMEILEGFDFEKFYKIYIDFVMFIYTFSSRVNFITGTEAEQKMILIQQYQLELERFLSIKHYTAKKNDPLTGESVTLYDCSLKEIVMTRQDRVDLVIDMSIGLFDRYEKDLAEAKQELIRMGIIKGVSVETQPMTYEMNKLRAHTQEQEEIIAQLTAIAQKLQADKIELERKVEGMHSSSEKSESAEGSTEEIAGVSDDEKDLAPAQKESQSFLTAWEILGKKSPAQKRKELKDAEKEEKDTKRLAEEQELLEKDKKENNEKYNIKQKLQEMKALKKQKVEEKEAVALREEELAQAREKEAEQKKLDDERTAFLRKAIDFELSWDDEKSKEQE